MARDQVAVSCPAGEWTELTNANVTNLSFQVLSGAVKIRFTTGSAPSAVTDAGYEYHASTVEYEPERSGEVNIAVASLAAGAGIDRAFAIPINGRRAIVLVDHA